MSTIKKAVIRTYYKEQSKIDPNKIFAKGQNVRAYTVDGSDNIILVSHKLGDAVKKYSELTELLVSPPDGVVSGFGLSIDSQNLLNDAGVYRVSGVTFSKDAGSNPIDDQDATLSRYDILYGDNTGTIGIVSGDLSATPVYPALPSNSILIGAVLITPTSVSVIQPGITNYVTTNTDQIVGGSKTYTVPQYFNSLTYFNGGVNLDNSGTGQSIFNSHYVLADYSGGGIAGLFNYNSVTDPSTNYLFGFDATNNYLIFGNSSGRHRLLTDLDLQAENGIYIDGSNNIALGVNVIIADTFLNSFTGNTIGISSQSLGEATDLILTPSAFHFTYSKGTTINSISLEETGGAFVLNDGSNITGIELLGNGVTIYDGIGLMGMGYQADYSATGITHYGDRWIPDIGYISAHFGAGSGSVTSVSVTTANGVSGSVANATTTPAITLTLGAITPTSVNGTTSTEIGYVSGVTSAIQTQLNTKLSSTTAATTYMPLAGGTFTGDVQQATSPVNSTSLVNKSYVDNLITGITWKNEVRAATTANITLSGTQTVDGIALIAGDRVLVKNQTTQTQNGLYVVASGAWTRSTDADSGTEIGSATVLVRNGTVNKDTQWTCTNSTDPVIGTDNITFGQIAGAGVYTNGTGIALGGNSFSLDLTYTDGRYGQLSSPLSQFASTTSLQLLGVISDETGTGSLVFATSPALAGTPTAPTAAGGTNTTQIATTAFVTSAISTAGAGYVPYTGASSNVNLGTNFIAAGASLTPLTAVHAISTATTTPRGILSDQNTADTLGARITMRKSRGTPASPTVITTGDVLGSWTAAGYTNAYTDSAKVLVTSTGTISNGVVPSIMEFQTMTAAGTLTTGVKIDQAQLLTFGGYATNGYVKTSGGIGTISVSATIPSSDISGTTQAVGDITTAMATDQFVYQNATGAEPNYFYPGSLYKMSRISLGNNTFLAATAIGNSLTPTHITFLGDSRFSYSPNYILDYVAQYGKLNSIGFISPWANIYGSAVTWAQTASIATRNDATSAQTWGIAGARIDMATGNTWSVQPSTRFPFDKFRIYYNKTVGGGTFSYSIDGGAATNVNTDPGSGADTLGVVVVNTTLNNQSSHTILLTGVSGSSRVYGMDFQNQSQDGFIVDILQSGGSRAQQWATSGVLAYTTQYVGTNATSGTNTAACVMWLDVNDANLSRTGTQYIADIRSIISALALPTTSSPIFITYMPQMTTNSSGIEDPTVGAFLSAYRTNLLAGVSTDGWSVIDLYKSDPSVATMNTLGYYSDNQHFSTGYATTRWALAVKSVFSGVFNQYLSIGNYPNYIKRSILIAPTGVVGFGLSTESGGGAQSETNTGWYGVVSNGTNVMKYLGANTELLRMGSNGSTNTTIHTYYPTSTYANIFEAFRQGSTVNNAFKATVNSNNSTTLATNNAALSLSATTVAVSAILTVGTTVASGVAGTASGAYSLSGVTSGTISILPQAAAGTYNFNMPITVGTAGTVLTSQGGGSTAMTWTALLNKPHNITTPTTGGTVSLTNNQYNIINPAGALLALTVNLPSSPANNDCVFIKYTQNITTVTYGNGTVVDGITAPTAGGLVVLVYDSGTTSWY